MITNINFDTGPIRPGESRPLDVWSNTGPIFVAIQCFREPPQPAQLTSCQECGSYTFAPGDHFVVTASRRVFTQRSGYLRVVVRDASGDTREFTLSVETTSGTGGLGYVTAEL